MSRFFWFANVLFRLSCNSPDAARCRTSLAHSRGAATQGDAHPCSHRFAARLRRGGYVPVRHADAARRRISLGRHLLQYVTGIAAINSMMKLRRFTKRLRYRCGLCFANFNHPLPTQAGRACRGRHEDAEGAQRAQCPNSSAPAPYQHSQTPFIALQ